MSSREITIGTRGSELAMWQANFVKARLESFYTDLVVRIEKIKTTGDEIIDIPLAEIGDKGLFTKQIEAKLLSGDIDLAVHSLKDLQTTQPEGLTIGAVLERELPNDVLIAKNATSIAELPKGAVVASGSARRTSQLLNMRPDLNIVEIRGNVPTRLRKFDESGYDAMILAYAGLHRLGLDDRIAQIIPFEEMIPAVGQGAVAVEIRENDGEIAELLKALDHAETRVCITAERSFLRSLEGGCHVPIGALARLDGGEIVLDGFVGTADGATANRSTLRGRMESAEELGVELAGRLRI